jgi:hypothetical protein
MENMGDLISQDEERLLAQAKADMAAEMQRYNADPAYRSLRDAAHKAKLDAYPDTFVQDNEDEGE